MSVISRFVPEMGETREQFGSRLESARSEARGFSRGLRMSMDTGEYGGMTAGEVFRMAEIASVFPEEVVAEMPDMDAPSREAMVDKLVAPYVGLRMRAASASASAAADAAIAGRGAAARSALARTVGTTSADIDGSMRGDNESGSYTQAMSLIYR